MREYMDDKIALTGIVLIAAPIGESDKRLVLLTRERGKVTVFARGARRPGNPFLAAENTFAFGTFYVKEARTAYQLVQTEIRNYFREITEDVEAACYGSYFLEFADYYARENDDGTQIIQLLYGALRAVLNQKLDRELIRYAFELRMMAAGGEYPQVFECAVCGAKHDLCAFLTDKNSGTVPQLCLKSTKEHTGSGINDLYDAICDQYAGRTPLCLCTINTGKERVYQSG